MNVHDIASEGHTSSHTNLTPPAPPEMTVNLDRVSSQWELTRVSGEVAQL